MIKNLKKSFLGTVAALALVASQTAAAGLLTVTVGGQSCSDGQACDLNAAANQVTVVAGSSAGITLPAGFAATIGSSFSNNPGGGGGFSLLDLTWAVFASTGGSVTVSSSQSGFTFPASGPALLTSSISGDVSGGSVSGQQYLDALTPGLQGPFTSPNAATTTLISNSASLGVALSGPYTLTETLSFTLGANGGSTGDFKSTVTPVPEPVTVALLGIGLLGLAFSRRKQG